MFVSVGFVIALQKPEHAGVDTPNHNQSKLKLESVKQWGVQVTGLPSEFLSWFYPFCRLCRLLVFLTVTALRCSHGPMPLVPIHVHTKEGRDRAGWGCRGAPGENMWICFLVGPFCKSLHFFQEWSPSCFCVGTQWSKHSPNCRVCPAELRSTRQHSPRGANSFPVESALGLNSATWFLLAYYRSKSKVKNESM